MLPLACFEKYSVNGERPSQKCTVQYLVRLGRGVGTLATTHHRSFFLLLRGRPTVTERLTRSETDTETETGERERERMRDCVTDCPPFPVLSQSQCHL